MDLTTTKGELFWNRRFKFYFTSGQDWESLGEDRRLKHVVHPIPKSTDALSKNRSKSATTYWPVTFPRSFRRSLTRIHVLRNHIFIFKHVKQINQLNLKDNFCTISFSLNNNQFPFELSEHTANVKNIRQIIKEKYGVKNPIILDQRYLEVKDYAKTRGYYQFLYTKISRETKNTLIVGN